MLSLLMCKSATETTLDKVTPEPTVRPTGGNKVHVYIRGHIWGWKSPSGSVCACVCVCVCVCVLPSRLVLGNFYSVWTSTDVKKSFQFRFSFPQLCNEDKNAQTKQIQISPTD